MTEYEKKFMLTKDEYDYLIEKLGYESPNNKKPIIHQINYYFDTDDLCMNRQNITCRVRWKNDKYKATMKRHSRTSEHSTETEMEIHDGLNKNAFTDMGLSLQGALSTDRCVIIKSANCEAVLDKNEYLGYVDHELEIEYAAGHEEEAQAVFYILRDMLIQRRFLLACKEGLRKESLVPSKSTRFFERKKIADQASQKIENPDIDPQDNMQNSLCTSLRDNTDFTYSDPDDYMTDYYGSIMARGTVCSSCEHFNNASCKFPYESCQCGTNRT